MTKRKIALVGIGKIARDQHIPSLIASRDWELAATVSRNASVEGVEAFTNIESMLEARPDVACVSFCTPPGPRFAAALSALRAGRHVMLEKPPGASVGEVLLLEKEAARAGVSLFASWHSRCAKQVDAARDWLHNKTIQSAKIVWREDVRRWHPGQTWLWEPGGLGVFDPGINALSIFTRIAPNPFFVGAATLEVPQNRNNPIAAKLEMCDAVGTVVDVEFDFREQGPQIWSILVETDQGQLELHEGGARLIIDAIEVTDQGVDVTLAEEYPRLYQRFSELVSLGESDVDVTPLQHVADAFLLGERKQTDAFVE